jgi:hypothetical protein
MRILSAVAGFFLEDKWTDGHRKIRRERERQTDRETEY